MSTLAPVAVPPSWSRSSPSSASRSAPTTRAPRPPTPVDPYAVAVPRSQVRAAVRASTASCTGSSSAAASPGVAVAVVDRAGSSRRGYGTTNTAGGRQVDADTVFQLASLSKPIGATVMARARRPRAGRLERSRRGSPPGLPARRPVRHRARDDRGPVRGPVRARPTTPATCSTISGVDRGTILERLRLLPLAPFRAEYGYTNFGIVAAADAVAARRPGTPWGDLSRRLVLPAARHDAHELARLPTSPPTRTMPSCT